MPDREQQIADLIKVVYLHEQLRALYGAGLVTDPRYEVAHKIMSKLSRNLGSAPLMQNLNKWQGTTKTFQNILDLTPL